MTGEELTKLRTEKLEKQLHKVKKKNWVNECTNKMYQVLKGINISADMNPLPLYLYIIWDSPTITIVARFLESNGKFTQKARVYYHNEGYYIVNSNQ